MAKKKDISFTGRVVTIIDYGFNNLLVKEVKSAISGVCTYKLGIDLKANIIEVIAEVFFKENENLILTSKVGTLFSILDLEKYLNDNKGLPVNTEITLVGISFGHLRAVLFMNTAINKCGTVVVPLINPYKIVEEIKGYEKWLKEN